METLVKPKLKKKHKELQEPDEVNIEPLSLDGIDIDFPTTSMRDEIPSHECYVASAATTEEVIPLSFDEDCVEDEPKDIISQDDASNSIVPETEAINDDNELATAPPAMIEITTEEDPTLPTAPIAKTASMPVLARAIIAYPNLESMQNIEAIATRPDTIRTPNDRIILKPFAQHQLKEFYANAQLQTAQTFECEFIGTELGSNYKDHMLYELLVKYSKSRYNLKINLMDLENYKKSFQQHRDTVWLIENRTVQYSGICKDGVCVNKSENYDYAIINNRSYETVCSSLGDLLNLIQFNYTLSLYATNVHRIQIEQYVCELITSRAEFMEIDRNLPAILKQNIEPNLLEAIRQLRIAISILFHFIRKPIPDKIFFQNIKLWLKKIVAIHLRMATWQDHLFLLFHVLRCPPGIASWAMPMIQVPQPLENASINSSHEINYCLVFLKILMLPIKQRNEFLAQLHDDENRVVDAVKEELWVLVDSDGEDDNCGGTGEEGLKENDLVSLLNQLPLQKLFGTMTFANLDQEKGFLDEKFITGQHLLRFIAFSTNFIELLGQGLKTYNTERYKQFAKMLCRLIRHTVLYVSDMHKIYTANSCTSGDAQTRARVQIEYDTFVLRASSYIYKSRFLGTWQYLAILPFSDLYIENAWKLYYSLSVDFADNVFENVEENFMNKIHQTEFMEKFNDSIIDIPVEDMYYLLQTFSSIALAREKSDWDFIQRITLDLFKIGFINQPTKESCYKIVKDLLGNITLKYPQLISSILVMLKDNFQLNDTGSTYLFKSLPLNHWKPTLNDFEIAAAWLLNFSYETPESTLARTIFSRLNWNFDTNDELFLPHDIHIRTACLIAQVSSKHVPEIVGSSGISESVRQVSNLVKTQSAKQHFTNWCWNMISVLRLHCLDQNRETVLQTLRNPNESFKLIPELERIQPIFESVSDSRPLALYLSILCSMWGHSVPQICHKGFIQMQLLLSDYRHSIVIRCLHLIAPLFLECPESLSQCEKFQSILTQLLTSDRTYIRMAKDLITSDYPGPVVELFGQMIQAQLIDYYNYGLPTPALLVNLWIQCLTRNPNWVKDSNAMYIIDLILSIAYLFPDAWISAREYFRFLHMQVDELKVAKVSSFLPFLGGSRPCGPFPVPSSSFMWLSHMILDLEHEIFEINSRFWPELLRELQTTNGKTSLDSVVKKCATLLNCSTTTINALSVYKLANFILTCAHEHPLLPIVCQKFFYLYLARIPITCEEERFADKYGVSDCFHDANVPLMKKMKKYFADTEKYYNETSLKESDTELSQFYNGCMKLFRSYSLWLEENRFNTIASIESQSDFPPQYNLHKLAQIFTRNQTPWNEYISCSKLRSGQKEAANNFLKSNFRYTPSRKVSVSTAQEHLHENPADVIVRHLKSYDLQVKAIEIDIDKPPIEIGPKLHFSKRFLVLLQNNFLKLDEAAKQFDMNINDVKSLDCNYKELIGLLYKNEKLICNRVVQCSSMLSKSSCSGSGSTKVEIYQPVLNDTIDIKITNNRERHQQLINKQTASPPQSTIMAIVEIHHFIKQILDIYQVAKKKKEEAKVKAISDIGIQFFYTVVNGLNEYLNVFPPANELCAQTLSNLGILIQQNQTTEGITLLKTALRRPNLVKLISDLFIPSATAPIYFLEMYKFIVDSHMRKCDTKILFVLLSKFDIPNWLVDFKPKLCDISQLLRYIVQGLECWNQNDALLIQGVLRRHLIHIFEYEFPEHYGEVIQIVINGSSDQKLMPNVLMDLLKSIYKLANCTGLQIDSQMQSTTKLKEDIINFATTQKLLSFKDIQDTMGLLARHFQSERLQHGLHGLYPKHKNYCDTIALLFKSLGYSIVVAAVHAYPGLLADNLLEWLWPSFCDMFSPWLVPYFPQNTQNLPANWIKQIMANNQVLLPWSELHVDSAQKMLHTFVDCLQFTMDTLPANILLLGNVFYWYEIHFAHTSVPRHILTPIHGSLTMLPWNRFHAAPVHINCVYRILQQFLPECHTFTGIYIFLRVNWSQWLNHNLPTWDYVTRQKVLSSLLLIFVKFAYEPHVRENSHFVTLILEAATYPWHFVDYQGIENMYEWFNTSTEPSIILRLRSEHGAIDSGVLSLLQIVSAMVTLPEHNSSESQMQAKRILYVKNVVRMLRICGSRHHQLLSTAEGLSSFNSAVVDLIDMIEQTVANNNINPEVEAINLIMEITGALQSQREYALMIFVKAIIIWQSKSKIGSPVLCSMLNTFGMCKQLTSNILTLLEATLFNYFRGLGFLFQIKNNPLGTPFLKFGISLAFTASYIAIAFCIYFIKFQITIRNSTFRNAQITH